MALSSIRKSLILVALAAISTVFIRPVALAGVSTTTQPSDFSRLVGTWQAAAMTGKSPVALTWINRTDGYTTTIPGPKGPEIVGSGNFQAQDGYWQTTNWDGQGDEGVYHFMDPNNVVFEGEAGVIVVWTRRGNQENANPTLSPTAAAQASIAGTSN
jgi:hypothetical protein